MQDGFEGTGSERGDAIGAAARALDWDGVPNVRDLGGLPTDRSATGRTLPGRVARGPRRELLSAAGWRRARAWGLRSVVDLRCPEEAGRGPGDPPEDPEAVRGVRIVRAALDDPEDPEFRRVCFPLLDSPEYWPHAVRIVPERIRAALQAVARAEPGVYLHCSAGRDRTGMVSAFLLATAGVDAETIAEDHAVSVRAMARVRTHTPTADRQRTWDEARVTAWIAQTRPHVLGFAARVPEHLAAIGLPEADLRRLRGLLLA
ncbi:MAG: tyrosine-protein phosphatase [Pseudoclavibacter sp.]|nr:tyrosine-protein phosphatase [Pseudoclavibacter sp.]